MSINDLDDLLGDDSVELFEAPDEEALSSVSELAKKQVYLQQRVDELEQDLKIAKEDLRTVSEQDLPEALNRSGLSEIKLDDGTKISVTDFVSAYISKDRQDDAFGWLEDNGYADIIKHEVTVRFNRDEDSKAHETVDALRARGLAPQDKKSVHASTLKAWAKEQTQKGVDIPEQLFGIYIGSKTKITKA